MGEEVNRLLPTAPLFVHMRGSSPNALRPAHEHLAVRIVEHIVNFTKLETRTYTTLYDEVITIVTILVRAFRCYREITPATSNYLRLRGESGASGASGPADASGPEGNSTNGTDEAEKLEKRVRISKQR